MAVFVAPKSSTFKANKLIKSVIAGILVLTANITFAHSSYDERDDYEKVVEILEQGNLAEVKQLVAGGLDVNQDLNNDGTPLVIAVQSGSVEVVEYLLSRGADINLSSETDGNPLVAAALNNNLELVNYLYKQGAELDAVTEYDETALISASRKGHFEVVKYLVENGADVNLAVEAKVLQGTELRTPLNGAKTKQIRNYLIAQGAHG